MSPGAQPPCSTLGPDGLPKGYPFRAGWEATPREVRDELRAGAAGTPGFMLLDCRRDDEHRAGRIEGAVHIPMEETAARIGEVEGEEGMDRPVVVYCHHGRRSLQVTALLRERGFTNVRSMAGGIDLWSIDIDPGVPRY